MPLTVLEEVVVVVMVAGMEDMEVVNPMAVQETLDVSTVEKKAISQGNVLNQDRKGAEDALTAEKKVIEQLNVLKDLVKAVETTEGEVIAMLPASNVVKLDTCLGTAINREASLAINAENRDISQPTVLMLLRKLLIFVTNVVQVNTSWLNVTNSIPMTTLTSPLPSASSATKRVIWQGTALRTRMACILRVGLVMDVVTLDTLSETVLKPRMQAMMTNCHGCPDLIVNFV